MPLVCPRMIVWRSWLGNILVKGIKGNLKVKRCVVLYLMCEFGLILCSADTSINASLMSLNKCILSLALCSLFSVMCVIISNNISACAGSKPKDGFRSCRMFIVNFGWLPLRACIMFDLSSPFTSLFVMLCGY